MRTVVALGLCVACLPVAACGETEAKQILLVVEDGTDDGLRVPDQVDAIRVRVASVFGGDAASEIERLDDTWPLRSTVAPGGVELPQSLAILPHPEGSGVVSILVQALRGTGVRQETVRISAFGPGLSRIVVAIDPACFDVACPTGQECIDGSCATSGPCPAGCDDGIPCTIDVCNGDDGCVAIPDDGRCDDGVSCTADVCDPASGCRSEVTDALCTPPDACSTVFCDPVADCQAGPPIDCDDEVGCTVDSCDPGSGCRNDPDDSACDDGEPCTDDLCAATGCVNDDNDDPCDDGDACNGPDECRGGACRNVGPPASDGTICGPDQRWRCCDDRCRNVWADPTNCGACGISCPSGDCMRVHTNKGVCIGCNTFGCPSGQTCVIPGFNDGNCSCTDATSCGGAPCVEAETLDHCRHP